MPFQIYWLAFHPRSFWTKVENALVLDALAMTVFSLTIIKNSSQIQSNFYIWKWHNIDHIRHCKILIFDVTPLPNICYSPNELGQVVTPYTVVKYRISVKSICWRRDSIYHNTSINHMCTEVHFTVFFPV